MFAIKTEVTDPAAKTFTFNRQKTMYGGKRIAEGDTVFIFASENEGGAGLVASGVVTSATAVPRKPGVERQTPCVNVTIRTHRAGEAAAGTKRAQAVLRLERRPSRDRAQLQVLPPGHEQDRRHLGRSGRIPPPPVLISGLRHLAPAPGRRRMAPTMTILDELRWRGLLADCTDMDALAQRIAHGPITLYAGFDPTADSLHVGNLVPLFALRRFQVHGHRPIALAGGSTGMIGDPSGKSEERNLLTLDQLAHNLEGIRPQLAKFLDFDVASNPARLVNNVDWTGPVGVLDFLRDVGKHVSVNAMVAKDSVRSRMEARETGISYAEFSYMLLQGFDFYHLRKTYDCELQIGATDQWGNITVGTELTRKKLGATVWGLVFPLLTKPDGTKYGKTAEGAVWLDPRRTSRYRFYQFFVNAEDDEVGVLLRALTFLPEEEIEALEVAHLANPGARTAQKALARELTSLVHGADGLASAERASEILFGGSLEGVGRGHVPRPSSAKSRRTISIPRNWPHRAPPFPTSWSTPGSPHRRARRGRTSKAVASI
jgi:tyrosyl-tRNA synthetase